MPGLYISIFVKAIMPNWITLLYSWNAVNQLYFNQKNTSIKKRKINIKKKQNDMHNEKYQNRHFSWLTCCLFCSPRRQNRKGFMGRRENLEIGFLRCIAPAGWVWETCSLGDIIRITRWLEWGARLTRGDRDGVGANSDCPDFAGSPVERTPRFHCRGPGFDPWSGN